MQEHEEHDRVPSCKMRIEIKFHVEHLRNWMVREDRSKTRWIYGYELPYELPYELGMDVVMMLLLLQQQACRNNKRRWEFRYEKKRVSLFFLIIIVRNEREDLLLGYVMCAVGWCLWQWNFVTSSLEYKRMKHLFFVFSDDYDEDASSSSLIYLSSYSPCLIIIHLIQERWWSLQGKLPHVVFLQIVCCVFPLKVPLAKVTAKLGSIFINMLVVVRVYVLSWQQVLQFGKAFDERVIWDHVFSKPNVKLARLKNSRKPSKSLCPFAHSMPRANNGRPTKSLSMLFDSCLESKERETWHE